MVAALRDELWPVREAALQTLRKLRPQQLRVWSHQVRCKSLVPNGREFAFEDDFFVDFHCVVFSKEVLQVQYVLDKEFM